MAMTSAHANSRRRLRLCLAGLGACLALTGWVATYAEPPAQQPTPPPSQQAKDPASADKDKKLSPEELQKQLREAIADPENPRKRAKTTVEEYRKLYPFQSIAERLEEVNKRVKKDVPPPRLTEEASKRLGTTEANQ